MIGRSLAVLILSGLAVAAGYRPYEGVDPNTLSCDPEGQIFLLLPHFTDCNKFFMCAHGQEVEFACSPELVFDFEKQTCNWPWAATCNLRNPEEGDGDEEIEGSGEGSQEWLPEHKTASPERAPLGLLSDLLDGRVLQNVARPAAVEPRPHSRTARYASSVLNCQHADSSSKHAPYPSDCQKFWRCVEGLPQVGTCSDGLYYNARTQQCDFEANAKCELAQQDELQTEFIVYK